MRVRYAALAAIAAFTVAVPASADNINCAKQKTSTEQCLRTGGQVEAIGTDKADRIIGTSGPDEIYGIGGPDYINGGNGDDRINGGSGNDRLYGGAGDDIIQGNGGLDRIYGGSGDDKIYARDGMKDVIDCGPGKDEAYVDADDTVKNCEKVVRRR